MLIIPRLTAEVRLATEGTHRGGADNRRLEVGIDGRPLGCIQPLQLAARGDVEALHEVEPHGERQEGRKDRGRCHRSHHDGAQNRGESRQPHADVYGNVDVQSVDIFAEAVRERAEAAMTFFRNVESAERRLKAMADRNMVDHIALATNLTTFVKCLLSFEIFTSACKESRVPILGK